MAVTISDNNIAEQLKNLDAECDRQIRDIESRRDADLLRINQERDAAIEKLRTDATSQIDQIKTYATQEIDLVTYNSQLAKDSAVQAAAALVTSQAQQTADTILATA
jgi:hypothetical protein